MGGLTKVVRLIDSLNKQVGKIAGWIALLMVAVVTVDVILRYLFNISFVFVQELEWQLFGVLFLIGAGYTLLVDGHVRVDVFYQRWSEKTKAWVNLIGVIFFLIPGCFLVIDTSWGFFLQSLAINEGSPDPGGIPARYVLKFFIPLGFALLTLQGVSLGIKNWLIIKGRPYADPAAEADIAGIKEGKPS
jgi:TRAP-type mannitol/chloroaromatic compound transport system permease small subunit